MPPKQSSKSRAFRELRIKLFNSRFFTVSLLFHLVLVLLVGGKVIISRTPEPPDFIGGDGESRFVLTDPAPALALPQPAAQPSSLTPTAQSAAAMDAVVSSAPAAPAFQLPVVTPALPSLGAAPEPGKMASAPAPNLNPNQLSTAQAQKIREFSGGWAKDGGKSGGSAVQQREFQFVAYLAKYGDPQDPRRGGDWASTNVIKDGRIMKGSLPNLLYFMNKLSKGRIKANPVPEPLDLSSDDIFVKKPPFIFFTGHRDFVLTDKEIENLQKYIQIGGCIWGDSSLPGRRSRFDMAFRREMRRVIPDADKDWEAMPPNDPLFTRNAYYPEIKAPPTGVNYYREPVYALRFGGEVAVLYTLNDYGDMWRLALNDNLEIDKTTLEHSNEFVYSDNGVFSRMEVYYRGLELPKLKDAYKFGTNVVVHLLTRWEDRLKTAPAGL